MADQEQVLIEVKFDTSAVEKARKALQENINALAANKRELAEMQKNIRQGNALTEEGAKRYAELTKLIETNKREIKSNTAILQAASTSQEQMNATLDQQRQYLGMLQKAFAGLTAEQKEAMGGEEALQRYIKELNDSLVEQEHQIGENGRNVGNYTESIQRAFGEMAHAGELLSPAIGLLRGMGGEGKKAAAALDALSKVMQLAGKAGKVFATAQKAQTAATEGATVAQEGLNAAMSANPIGLIVAAVSTLLPLVQSLIDSFGDATKETEAFNNELERQNRLIEQAQQDAEFQSKLAGVYGASAAEQLRIRRNAAKESLKIAEDEVDRLMQIRLNGNSKERKAAEEALATAIEQRDNLQKQLNAINQEATLQDLKDKKAAEDQETKNQQQALEERKKNADAAREEEAKAEREYGIMMMEARLALARYEAEQRAQQDLEMQQQAQAMLAELNEEEDEENIPTPDEMVRNMWGLDAEGLEYFKSLLDQGVSFAEAKTQAIAEQSQRMTKAWSSSFGSLSNTFKSMSDLFGEFAEESEEAATAQKAFALMGIITDQAQSIANGALAISEGIASAASLPFPANIPAIVSIVATIGGLMAGVASSIVQAKQVFSQADAGKFAQGGIVGGSSYSGDNMIAHVNSREMILPMDAQKTLFDALSSSTNGQQRLGIDYELMAQANAALPAPVVVYTEMQEFGDKVATYQEIARV